jgi:glycosyltransferase involved in cell wall biosynthesis
MNNPFFSIIIPTRNRADLLYYSLKCAKAQEFDNFEILVSNNYSSDETEKVVLANLDKHTRYITTNQPLAMPDSWEFALAHAQGEYILLTCDDDALRPDLLKFLFEVIKNKKPYCISWMNGVYYHPDWYDESKRNSCWFSSYTHNLSELNSTTLLRDLFDMQLSKVAIPLPKMLNSCCHRELLNKIKSIVGKTFLPICPDYSVAVATLALIPRFLFVESPLFLGGISHKTIGANAQRKNEAVSAFWDEFGEKSNLFLYTPLKSKTETNSISESFLRVKAAMPEKLIQFNLNLINYFVECRKEIDTIKQFNNDVTAEIEEFYAVLENQDNEIKKSVLAAIETNLQKPNDFKKIRNNILKRITNRLSKIRSEILFTNKNGRNLNPQQGIIYGSEYGFSNIAECAIKLKEMFPLPQIDW